MADEFKRIYSVRLPPSLVDEIDARLVAKENRSDAIREAITREISRRDRAEKRRRATA